MYHCLFSFLLLLLWSGFHQNAQATEPFPEPNEMESFQNGFEKLAISESANDRTLDVFFATNRNLIANSEPPNFGIDLRRDVSFGRATLASQGGEWRVKAVDIEKGPVVETLDAARLSVRRLGSNDNLSQLSQSFQAQSSSQISQFAARASLPNTDVLVFVHGAAHDFAGALSAAARIKEVYALPGRDLTVLAFTYPTNGRANIPDYFQDRRDAGMSGHAMASGFKRFLEFLKDLRQVKTSGRTFFVTHSLGGYASRVALQAISERSPALGKVFDVAFLMAADEDDDSLSVPAKMGPLLSIASSVAVYFADNDRLLWASSLGNLRMPIGLYGPSDADTVNFGGARVQALNATGCAKTKGDSSAHRYFIRSPCVVRDIKYIMGLQSPDTIEKREKLGNRTYKLLP